MVTEGLNFSVHYDAGLGHDVPSITLPLGAEALLACQAVNRVGTLAITEDYLS